MIAFAERRRPAFTLVELLIVIGLIIVVAAIGAATVPRVNENHQVTQAIDQLQQWMLIAKQRAKRDGVPTGLRFYDTNFAYASATSPATQAVFVQQPDNFSAGSCSSMQNNTTINFTGVDFTNGNPSPDQYLVQPGDYLQLTFGGANPFVVQIAAVTGDPVTSQSTITLNGTPYDSQVQNQFNSGPPTSYLVYRQPRRMVGEAPMLLPNNMIIDFTAGYSANVPSRTLPSGLTVYEIVFGPSGAVIGQGTGGGKAVFWVRDSNRDPTVDLGASLLVAVQFRTGFIGGHPPSSLPPANPPTNDPYQFTEDARSSGM